VSRVTLSSQSANGYSGKLQLKVVSQAQDTIRLVGITLAITIVGGAFVDDEGGQQTEGGLADLAPLHDQTARCAALTRSQWQDCGVALHGQGGRQNVWREDHGQIPAGTQAAQTGGNPDLDAGINAQGSIAASDGRGGAIGGIVWRVGDDVVKLGADGHVGHITDGHGHLHAVAQGVAGAEIGIVGLQFQPVMHQSRYTRSEAQGRGTRTTAQVKHAVARTGRHTCGEQDGVGRRAIAAAGLQDLQASAQKGVISQVDIGKHLETRRNVIVGQYGAGHEQIGIAHHQAAWQYAQGSVKDAHVDVHFEHGYMLALQQGLCIGDHGGVGGAQKLFHMVTLAGQAACVEGLGAMGLDDITQKPHDRLAMALATDMDAVNLLIRDRMASRHAPRIPEVTAHLVEAGGKRLRPMLTLAAARLCGYGGPYHIHLAATVEFIHTATLLHDDVVDASARRRGKPTANLLWDNKSSVLVGDYLFARSFQLMVETGSLRVLDILANASATIAEGEVLQLTAAQDLATNEGVYAQVIRGKTAALFAAATEVGGVIAGVGERQVDALRTYGDALGMAFQIVDDLLDYGGSDVAIGKNTGDDFRERKVTLPVIKAVAKASVDERAFWVRVIERGQQREGDLAQALAIMDGHGAMQAARDEAVSWAAQARDALWVLPDVPLRRMLEDLADYVVARVS
jgi:octaprenyl-diphosphate synthase